MKSLTFVWEDKKRRVKVYWLYNSSIAEVHDIVKPGLLGVIPMLCDADIHPQYFEKYIEKNIDVVLEGNRKAAEEKVAGALGHYKDK